MSLVFRKMNIVETGTKSHEAGVRAYVDITLNDTIDVNGFRVLEHGKGLWVSPPSQRSEYKGKTRYFNFFQFTKKEHNDKLAEDIIAQYKTVKAGAKIETPEVEPAY